MALPSALLGTVLVLVPALSEVSMLSCSSCCFSHCHKTSGKQVGRQILSCTCAVFWGKVSVVKVVMTGLCYVWWIYQPVKWIIGFSRLTAISPCIAHHKVSNSYNCIDWSNLVTMLWEKWVCLRYLRLYHLEMVSGWYQFMAICFV